MPFLPEQPRFKGITLPPTGWALVILLSIYIFTGLIGHDPWKSDDAITIGVVHDMLRSGNWLMPQLAGQAYPDAPLYYWVAASFSKLFSWLLPEHDATRLASGLFTLLALEFILLAARELHGKEFSASAPLLLAGSIGFLFHAHEAQPMLAALTAHTAAYWALALLPRRPRQAAIIFGCAVAVGFLANGLLPVFTLIPITCLALWKIEHKAEAAKSLAAALLLALALIALWILPLWLIAPRYLADFWQLELNALDNSVIFLNNTRRYLNLLLWYAWPALPLAAWSLWSKRRVLKTRPLALPVLSFLGALLLLGAFVEMRSAPSLLLLPPLVLIAVPGVATLRRGAANAFDWFGMMIFTFLAAVTWVAWSAMVFEWPARLAKQVVRLTPGFEGQFHLFATLFALLATLTWFWLVITSPRSPMRGIMHWMAGLTLFWLLLSALWMPWINYGKSYRALSASLAQALPDSVDCIANANLSPAILASLDYFDGVRTVPAKSAEGKRCSWLLVQGATQRTDPIVAAGWRIVWEDKRASDRHANDYFHLYRRQVRGKNSSLLELPPEVPAEQRAKAQ